MEMKTERLVVRSFRFEDNLDLFEMCCDVQTAKAAGWKPHNTLEDSKSVVSTHIYEDDTFAIVLKDTNKVIGTISLYPGKKDDLKVAELGFCLNKKFRKQGYMLEAAKLMLDIAFRAHRVDLLTTCHDVNNVDCKKLINKLPFKSEGVIEKHRKLYDGTVVDCEVYTIKTEDY